MTNFLKTGAPSISSVNDGTIIIGASSNVASAPGTFDASSLWDYVSGKIVTRDEVFNVKDYGAVGNGIVDDTAAFQSAFAAMATNGGELFIPCGEYIISSPVIYQGRTGFKIRGGGSTLDDGVYGAGRYTTIIYTGAHTDTAFSFLAPGDGNHLMGMVIEGITICRSTPQTTAQVGYGIKFVGVYPLSMSDVTVDGFNTGIWTDDDAAGTRSGKGTFKDVAVINAARYRMWLRGICDVQFIGCRLYEDPDNLPAAYTADVRIEPGSSASSRCDGLNFFGCAFIGANTAGLRPANNVISVDSLNITFNNCAFERSATAGLSVVRNSGVIADTIDAVVTGCWFDAHTSYSIDAQRVRIVASGNRILSTGSVAALRIVGDPSGATKPNVSTMISGGLITYNAVAGVQVVHASSVTVTGVAFNNTSGGSLPSVSAGSNTGDVIVLYDQRGTNVVKPSLSGTTSMIHHQSGVYGLSLSDYANDAAASAGGIVIGQMYRNGSVMMMRVT